jgi:hypothetical protein
MPLHLNRLLRGRIRYMAKDFWRIQSVDRADRVIVVENVNGLIDRLRVAGEAFTITPDGALAVEVDDAVIHKCADGLYRALVFTATGRATLTDNPNAAGPGITLRKGIPVDAEGNTFSAAHARLTPHITGPANPGPLGMQATAIAKSAGSGTRQINDSRDLSPEVTARLVKLHNPERRGRNPYRAPQRI